MNVSTKSRSYFHTMFRYTYMYICICADTYVCVRLLGNRGWRELKGETEKEKTGWEERERSNGDGSSNQCREMEHERNGASEEARPGENLLHLWHGTRWTMKKKRERKSDRERKREGEVMVGSVSC